MHRVDVFHHYFYVRNRIIWPEWEEFISGDRDGDITGVPITFPTVNANGSWASVAADNKLADYLGLPVQELGNNLTPAFPVSQLPFRAYQQVYNDYYRDPNLEDEVDFTTYTNFIQLRNRKWEKDYLTSALPFVQRGQAAGVPIDVNYLPQSIIKFTTAGDIPAGAFLSLIHI